MSRFGRRPAVSAAMVAAVSLIMVPAVAPSAAPAPAVSAAPAAAPLAKSSPPTGKAVFFASDGLRQDLVEKYASQG